MCIDLTSVDVQVCRQSKLPTCFFSFFFFSKTFNSLFSHSQSKFEITYTTITTIVFIFLANYSSTVKSKQVELKESCSKINNFNKEEERIANEKTSNEVKFNKLIMLESQNQEKIDKRNVMLVENAKLAGKILYGLQVSYLLVVCLNEK